VEALIPKIPPEDIADMIRGWGQDSATMLRQLEKECPDTWSIFNGEDACPATGQGGACPATGQGGEIVAMLGCQPTPEGGCVWLMRGADMDTVAVQFVRHSGPFIDAWLQTYGELFCYFSADYKKLLRFMKWSGFDVEDLGNGYVRCSKSRDK
jgi:hypothetical protein